MRAIFPLLSILGLLLASGHGHGAEPVTSREPHEMLEIDLPTALKLAGARNLDVKMAREQVAVAQANHEMALWNFFPALSPGVSYRRHDNLIQTVEGRMIQAEKDSYAVGPTIAAQVDIGDALFKKLAARQLVKAADYALESQRQESLLAAAQGYYDFVRAAAAIEVAREAIRLSSNYASQVESATVAGVAFKGDQLRAQVQVGKNRQILRRAEEQARIGAARLAQVLHLEPAVELQSRPRELVPLKLLDVRAPLAPMLRQALAERPELKESRSRVAAAREVRTGAAYGPLIPSAGAQIFAGGLGGSMNGVAGTFGESEDYLFTLGWRIGPGGLFDRGRIRAAESRLNLAQLSDEKLADTITREVIEAQSQSQSAFDRLEIARQTVQAAEEGLRLTSSRKEFGIGAVLENIQAEEELTQSRLEFINVVAEYNKAQFALKRALGQVADTAE